MHCNDCFWCRKEFFSSEEKHFCSEECFDEAQTLADKMASNRVSEYQTTIAFAAGMLD